jgi:hypothetical protein
MSWKTHNEGFAVDFPNGWTVSIVWGRGAYGSNHMKQIKEGEKLTAKLVEVGAWRTENKDVWLEETQVRGYLNHQEVLDYMQSVSNLPNNDNSGVSMTEVYKQRIADSID